MKINKKGMTAGVIVSIMITLVAFVLITGTLMRFSSKKEGLEAEIVCHNSLALRAKTSIQLGPEKVSTPALCKTIDRKFSAQTPEEAMDFMGKAIDRCWWIWLDGRVSEFFGPRGLFGYDDKTKCFVCNTLVYEDGPSFSKEDFIINSQKLKSKNRGGGSILDYVQENGYLEIYEEGFTAGNIYGVVFASNIKESFWVNSFARQLDIFPPYNQNGIWLLSMKKFDNAQPCYYQPDTAGD
jgi:hypothetical protein